MSPLLPWAPANRPLAGDRTFNQTLLRSFSGCFLHIPTLPSLLKALVSDPLIITAYFLLVQLFTKQKHNIIRAHVIISAIGKSQPHSE